MKFIKAASLAIALSTGATALLSFAAVTPAEAGPSWNWWGVPVAGQDLGSGR